MTIDKQKLQKLLWAEVAAWSVSAPDWPETTEALSEFLGKQTLEEVALELLAENERQAAQFKEWQASHHANYCTVADERDQLKAESEALRGALGPLLAHWDDLKSGESINVDRARAAMGKGEKP